MKIAIISDIHSNHEALSTVLRWIADNDIDETICLGDVIGYGPDPNPCCELIRERTSVTLLGNHDAAVIGVMGTDYYYPAARDALYWTRQQLSDDNFRWLYGLPFTHTRPSAAFFHAAPSKPSNWAYVVRTRDALGHNGPIYEHLARWNFVGHSHLTNQYAINGKRAKDVTGRHLQKRDDAKYIINVGSVGQPRDRDPRLCFGIFHVDEATGAETFEHMRLDYDIESVAQKIINAGLDEKFARRLFAGQ